MSEKNKNKKQSQDVKLLSNHEYDGIQELDNFMPRWWVWGFYFTILLSVGYVIYYHFLGIDKSSRAEYENEMKLMPSVKLAAYDPENYKNFNISKDKETIAVGEALFLSQACISCHGPTLGGLVGPNLTDNYWIHGCSVGEIMYSIKSGFPDKGMVPYGNGTKISDEQILQLVSFIASKKGIKQENPKAIDPSREVPCQIK